MNSRLSAIRFPLSTDWRPENSIEEQTENDPDRFDHLGEIDFRFADLPVFEHDRCFDERAAEPMATEQDLFHERVTATSNPGEVEFGEATHSITAKVAAVILVGKSQQKPGVPVDSPTHEFPLEPPSHDSASQYVARTDDDIRFRSQRQQIGNIPGRMTQIGVERQQKLVTVFDCIFESRDDGRTQSELSGSLDQPDS